MKSTIREKHEGVDHFHPFFIRLCSGMSVHRVIKRVARAGRSCNLGNMFKDAFVKLNRSEVAAVLEMVNPVVDGNPFDPGRTTVLAHDLPFWPGYRFLDVADYNVVPTPRRFVVCGEDQAVVLDGSNAPVYALNNAVPVVIDRKTVASYVRFFFSYVRGHHGRFTVVEAVDDIPWKDEPPPAARKAVGGMIAPLETKAVKDGFEVSLCLLFRSGLFRTSVHVGRDGQVSISREDLLIEDMPVADDVFG